MKCPRHDCKNEAEYHPTYGVLPCLSCQNKNSGAQLVKNPEFASITKQDRIQQQRDEHGKDIIQPFLGNKPNPEFAKAYPSKAKDYFTGDQLKDIG